ncbi:hypothetical protein MARI151_60016 [Maribacter litoralis]|uniref:Uncharacterized protein n=1 Tax=Maribacter litoralis TaxID=2059726 RepID=A0A653W9A2_9FLAO|nr:hypothetical protein MARI151_60016 [Maribacter litoralis]
MVLISHSGSLIVFEKLIFNIISIIVENSLGCCPKAFRLRSM